MRIGTLEDKKNARAFAKRIFRIFPEAKHEPGDVYEKAITLAKTRVPKVDYDKWFGAIGDGVFYSTSDETRWFPSMTEKEVARLLAEEIYHDCT